MSKVAYHSSIHFHLFSSEAHHYSLTVLFTRVIRIRGRRRLKLLLRLLLHLHRLLYRRHHLRRLAHLLLHAGLLSHRRHETHLLLLHRLL